MDFDEQKNQDVSTLLVGVLDEVIEIAGDCVRGIRKLQYLYLVKYNLYINFGFGVFGVH